MLKYLPVLFVFLFASCASVVTKQKATLNKNLTYTVLPFVNYTETPKAGLRAQSIVAGVIGSKGYKVNLFDSEEITSEKELADLIKKVPAGTDIIVTGYVNEWRYKTGIDGEPAVSLTIKFIDAKTMETVYSAALSRSGWSYESLGVVAQRLISSILNE